MLIGPFVVELVLPSPLVDAMFIKMTPVIEEEEDEVVNVPAEVVTAMEVVSAPSGLLAGRLDSELLSNRTTGVLELLGRIIGLIATCTLFETAMSLAVIAWRSNARRTQRL